MPEIKTEITIRASKEAIWQTLTDFESYPDWNPFIVRIEGGHLPGQKIRFKAHVSGKKFKFDVAVKRSEPNRFFSWTGPGPLLLRALVAGEHYFQIDEIEPGCCRFIHGEKFSGILIPLIWRKVSRAEPTYTAMNRSLKTRVESTEA